METPHNGGDNGIWVHARSSVAPGVRGCFSAGSIVDANRIKADLEGAGFDCWFGFGVHTEKCIVEKRSFILLMPPEHYKTEMSFILDFIESTTKNKVRFTADKGGVRVWVDEDNTLKSDGLDLGDMYAANFENASPIIYRDQLREAMAVLMTLTNPKA